jgi:hypothetical protein
MPEPKAFVILRKILGALGLPAEAVEELLGWVHALLTGKAKGGSLNEFPYRLREDFLSPAERSFYIVVRSAVASWATVWDLRAGKVGGGSGLCPKDSSTSDCRRPREPGMPEVRRRNGPPCGEERSERRRKILGLHPLPEVQSGAAVDGGGGG